MVSIEREQTLVLIKPDALKNSLTGYVLSQLSEFHTGLRFAATKIVHVSKMLADEHYAEHRGKVFFPALIEYIRGMLHYPNEPWKHRVIAIVYQGRAQYKKYVTLQVRRIPTLPGTKTRMYTCTGDCGPLKTMRAKLSVNAWTTLFMPLPPLMKQNGK